MMPVHFGEHCGPRQSPDGGPHDLRSPGLVERFTLNFLTRREALEALLPPMFRVLDPPVVSLDFGVLTEIPWLAGRGYNTFGMRFRARFEGKSDRAEGPFLAVLWENLADPIITGREQLGYNKIYAGLPPPRRFGGSVDLAAEWLGFDFFESHLSGFHEPSAEEIDEYACSIGGDGVLHHKYLPRTGEPWQEADADYITLTQPATTRPLREALRGRLEIGSGTFAWRRPRWEDMPTQHRIVNALADLPVLEQRASFRLKTHEAKDYRDQKILH
jgi:hypothetical protein